MSTADALVATLVPCPPPDALEREWRALEQQSDPPVFLSWVWIGAQIAVYGPPPYLVRITRNDDVVGLALLGYDQRPMGWPRRPSLHLHETGDPLRDSVMIEYNGVLTREAPDEVIPALLRALLTTRTPFWRELHLSGVDPGWRDQCRRLGLDTRLLRPPQAAPFAAFDPAGPDDPLDALSRNTRQQIRRSLRWFERQGPLTLRAAASASEAIDWLGALAELHSATWQARNQPGAFGAPGFALFHRTLIEQSFASGAPELLRIATEREPIGYLYNFIWRGWAHSYQSGLRYHDHPDCRPGLVAHLLALRRYRAQGLNGYRFLAGDSRYKASFATGSDPLLWMAVHRADWGHRLESWARTVHRSVTRIKPSL